MLVKMSAFQLIALEGHLRCSYKKNKSLVKVPQQIRHIFSGLQFETTLKQTPENRQTPKSSYTVQLVGGFNPSKKH